MIVTMQCVSGFYTKVLEFHVVITIFPFPCAFVKSFFLPKHYFSVFMQPWYILFVFHFPGRNGFVHIRKEFIFKLCPVLIH